MTDPPCQPPEHGEGDGPATNVAVPNTADPTPPGARSSMTTVTPPPWPPVDPPPASGGDLGPTSLIDLVWRLLGDPRRCIWVFAFAVVVLGTFVVVTALLAPHLGALGGVVGGLGAGAAGGTAVKAVHTHQRNRNDPDKE